MKVLEDVSLSSMTTMRTNGVARYLVNIFSQDDARSAVKFAHEKQLPWFVLSGGSNVIANDFPGVIIRNNIRGFTKLSNTLYRVGAGENLDDTIAKFCAKNLSGLEFLSAIPGLIGATPVQNVGAYGADISQVLVELRVYDAEADKFKILSKEDCGLSYRNSIFKERKNRKYIICDLTLRLSSAPSRPPFYASLQTYLLQLHPNLSDDGKDFRDGVSFLPSEIRDAVIKVRAEKLPDPREIPSAGSFFKNPLVDRNFATEFLAKNPTAPHWKTSEDKEKFSAGWLIDQANLKGFSEHGFQIYPENALVVVNVIDGNSCENLTKFRETIVGKIQEKFGITLDQEPEVL